LKYAAAHFNNCDDWNQRTVENDRGNVFEDFLV
jgi:hypothetical protein